MIRVRQGKGNKAIVVQVHAQLLDECILESQARREIKPLSMNDASVDMFDMNHPW